MPISRDGGCWERAARIDRLSVLITDQLLLEHPEKAFALEEIATWVVDEYPEAVPKRVRDKRCGEDVLILTKTTLDRLARWNLIEARCTDAKRGTLHYAIREDGGLSPSSRLEDEILPRLNNVENAIEELRAPEPHA